MGERPQHVWTQQQVVTFWNHLSQFPELYFTREAGPELIRQFSRHFAPSDQILDFGCGAGHLLDQLLRRGYRAGGSDSSPDTLARTRTQFAGRAGFLGADTAAALIAERRTFDVILVIEVIEHLYDDWLEGLLQTLRTLSKPGGRIIFTTPNEEDLEAASLICPCCGGTYHRMQHVRSWSRDKLSAYLEARGLPVIDAFTTHFGLSRAVRGKRLKILGKKLKYLRRPEKKRPHLAVICRLPDA